MVVLADREKEEMDDELRHSLKGYKIEWHTRSGAPHCSSDLDRVAAGQAKNVILLDDNTEVGCLHNVPLSCAATGPLSQLRCYWSPLLTVLLRHEPHGIMSANSTCCFCQSSITFAAFSQSWWTPIIFQAAFGTLL